MFLNKSFAVSTFFSKSKQPSTVNSVLQPKQNQAQYEQLKVLREQLNLVKNQLKEVHLQKQQVTQTLYQAKNQLQQIKQIFIEAKIQHDNQLRAYDQLIEQLRHQLQQKDQQLQSYQRNNDRQYQVRPISEQSPEDESQQQSDCQKENVHAENQLTVEKDHLYAQEQQNQQCDVKPPTSSQDQPAQISELMIESTIAFKEQYKLGLNQISQIKKQKLALKLQNQNLNSQLQKIKLQCQKINEELLQIKSKDRTQLGTNDASFIGKGQSKISFQFGDLTNQLMQIEQMAHFSHNPSQIVVDEQQITIRQERIENLERQNFELKHQMASKSHKLAYIFNAAFDYGGMKLLDYLQESIGLVQRIEKQHSLQQ